MNNYFSKKLELIGAPHVKAYEGFGNNRHFTIMGHTLLVSPKKRSVYNNSFLHNSLSLLKLFMTKPMPHALVAVQWDNKWYEKESEDDGFFVFDIQGDNELEAGIFTVPVRLLNKTDRSVIWETETHVTIPAVGQFTFISDIDDTFLISHSSTILKRIKVLLTKHAYSRVPFEGVVAHYQALQNAQTTPDKPNPFFYVSNSEWNLYDFITAFIDHNRLPDGVLLLNQIKSISKILKTGKNNHGTKFARIVRILETYPTQRFILLGDDSQRDPYIYNSITEHFPHLIHTVYIRSVRDRKDEKVMNELQEIEARNIHTCYFLHSNEALEDSKTTGLIR